MDGSDSVKGRDTLSLPQMPGGRDAPGYSAQAAHGTSYLPQPSGMNARDYQAYKTRAVWFGASARVRQGLVGLVFREGPEVAVSPLVEEHAKDITRTGVNLSSFAFHAVTDHLTTGRIGILLDLPEEDQPANAVRPQWTLYRAEQIINWCVLRTPQGETMYSQVILEEEVDTVDPEDPYKHKLLPQWRELLLDQGVYVVRVWRKVQGAMGAMFVLIEERIPTRRGAPVPFIPFLTLNADSLDMILSSPPLLDVVDLNFGHYRTNADYKHSLHMSALATAYVTGWDNTEAELKIGAMTAWVIPEPQARVGFLEVSGHGLTAMLEDMRATEAQMAVLGARLLEPQRRTVEAAETHQIRQSAELSIMEAYAIAASALLTKALRWHSWWAGVTEDVDDDSVTLTLNTDFLPTTVDAPTLTALVASWEAGALSHEDLYFNLARGNMLQPGVPFEEWQAKLKEEAPAPVVQLPGRGQPPAVPGAPPAVAGNGVAAS